MPIRIEDTGRNNRIDIAAATCANLNGAIHFAGSDSSLTFHDGSISDDIYVHIGSRVSVEIGSNCRLGKLQIYTTCENTLVIGANAAFTYETKLHMHEPSSIIIGSGALFADGVYITTSDMHSIIDEKTGERLNYSEDVNIGERVWLGMRVTILKGATIGSGSIIGACSVVAGNIPAFSIAAGQPARVRRQGVTWRQELL
jgi:acetyltransferase-like isoleucine patch superfamily enzyme